MLIQAHESEEGIENLIAYLNPIVPHKLGRHCAVQRPEEEQTEETNGDRHAYEPQPESQVERLGEPFLAHAEDGGPVDPPEETDVEAAADAGRRGDGERDLLPFVDSAPENGERGGEPELSEPVS